MNNKIIYKIVYTTKMKKDIKLLQKQGKDLSKLISVLDKLSRKELLPERYKDHQLKGNLKDFRKCHIEPD